MSATGVAGSGVVRWDGQAWTALGEISEATGSQVEAVAVAPDGTVFAGLNTYVPIFDAGEYVGSVVRWTGAEWVPTAPLSQSKPYGRALSDVAVSSDGTLYAAQTTGVSAWTGTSWTPIGGGWARVLEPDTEGGIYAGGGLVVDGVYGVGVARWDGQAWSRLGATYDADAYDVEALAVGADGTVYAGGRFLTFGGAEANHVSRWDGTAWRPMQGGVAKAAPGNFQPLVHALALAPDGTLHAGGRFDMAGDVFSPVIARWSGGAWQSSGGGISGAVYALARAADGRPVIGGVFRTAGGQVVNSAAIRDGESWASLGTGPYEAYYASITAIARDRDGDLIACGDNTYRWDGTAWSTTDSPSEPVRCNDLTFDSERGVVYSAGTINGQGTVKTVRQWDGDVWTPLGSPGSFVRAVAVAPDGTLYAAGPFGVARYGGAGEWTSIGALGAAPAGGTSVYDLAVGQDGVLYAGGLFESVGGVPARNVARWDGASWSPLGAGTDQRVRALLVDPARGLYAGGDFAEAGGVSAARIALWDGAAWAPLDGGPDGPVFALLADGPDGVLVGGAFARAGGTASPYVARWAARPVAAEAAAPTPALALVVAPNPASGALVLRATHPAGRVKVDVFDALGRHVARLFEGDAPAEEQRLVLDAARFAPGIYIVRLTTAGSVTSSPFSVVR